MLLAEVGPLLVGIDSLSKLFSCHLALELLELFNENLLLDLTCEDEEVEFIKGYQIILFSGGSDVHRPSNLLFVFFKVLSVIFWTLVVVWSQSLEEIWESHECFTFFVLCRSKCFKDLLW